MAKPVEETECPFIVGDGDLWVRDPDYLDLANESQGTLAVLNSTERGQWVLIGSGGEGTGNPYTQAWQRIGPDKPKPATGLRTIQ